VIACKVLLGFLGVGNFELFPGIIPAYQIVLVSKQYQIQQVADYYLLEIPPGHIHGFTWTELINSTVLGSRFESNGYQFMWWCLELLGKAFHQRLSSQKLWFILEGIVMKS
jgi:hypothetical protein